MEEIDAQNARQCPADCSGWPQFRQQRRRWRKEKDNSVPLKTSFTPIRTSTGFTLKAGPTYTGSYLLGTEKTSNYVSFNTLVTYERGNSVFILPYRYKMNTSVYLNNSGSNLRLLDLRVNLHK
ncbi:hypothetical protein ACQ86N_08105 [Puia sp. P3]|uniref:hypothetical protein n=1 Tax=Puia sp. P3 TaxID=3423952 RepID=UPI003D672AB8